MKIVWTDPAISDRQAIFDFVMARNPRAAVQLDERFAEASENLKFNPEIGRDGRISGTREFLAHRRYLLVYELINNEILILAIVHTSRQWPPIVPP